MTMRAGFDKYQCAVFLMLWLFLIRCDAENRRSSPRETAFRFSERSREVGLDFIHDPGVDGSYFMPESIGSGGALLDYDNDGDLDVYLINSGPHGTAKKGQALAPNRLFQQEGNGRFTDVTTRSGLGDAGYGMGVAVGDLNNDGFVDIYVTNYGPDALYRNSGDGSFSNITESAGIGNNLWGCSAVFLDFNLDGWLDIYVTNYVAYDPADVCVDRAGRRDYCGPAGFRGVPDVLYRNNHDGTFSDVSFSSGIAKASSKGLGVISADFNTDGLPDIYVANDEEANHLWINQGDGTFRDEALMSGVALNELGQAEAGMGVTIGDSRNIGQLDIFVTHLRTESNTLYRSADMDSYYDETISAGIAGPSIAYTGFGTGFLDIDNDGDLDLAVANGRVTRGPLLRGGESEDDYWGPYSEPNLLFENLGTGAFRLLPPETTTFSSSIKNSRGLLIGDIDNDGDPDLLVTNEGGPAQLFLNEAEPKHHWLVARVIDPFLNRDAFGAVVTATVAGRRLQRLVTPGYSYLSSNDHRVHFGLGKATEVDEIEVVWPGGHREIFPAFEADQFITLRKGETRKAPAGPSD